MEFNKIDIQRFDSTGNYALSEYYLLSYSYSDSCWTERFLLANFFIDIYYKCKIDISFYINTNKNSKSFRQRIENQIEINIPSKIKNLLVSINQIEKLDLKRCYFDTFLEDSQREDFVINHQNTSHNIGIETLFEKVNPQNESEELFFNIYSEIKKWREEVYDKILLETINYNVT